MSKKYLLLFICIVHSLSIFSQFIEQGLPLLNNYSPQDYRANNDNWAIEQDQRGIMFFGNSAGILEFDGRYWKNIAPEVFCYDMEKSLDGTIYTAGDNDFGYIGFNEKGESNYYSIFNQFKEPDTYYGTFYTVETVDSTVYFLSNRGFLYKWENNKLSLTRLPDKKYGRYKTLRYVNNRFYLQTPDGLCVIKDSIPELIPGGGFFKDKSIEEIFETGKDTLLLITRLNGLFNLVNNKLFPIKSNGSEFIKKNQVYVAKKIDNESIALGTIQNGVLVTDIYGNTRYNINREAGLQSNDHCEIFVDRNKNIWSALENGISSICRNSPFTQLNEHFNIPMAKVYSILIHQKHFYVGTAQGAYYATINSSNPYNLKFNYIGEPGARKILDMLEIDNQFILTASGTGTYTVKKDKAYRLSNQTFKELVKYNSRYIVGPLFYGGFGVLAKDNGKWILHKAFTGYAGMKYLNVDTCGNIWLVEDEKHISKITLNEDLNKVIKYEKIEELPGITSFDSVSVFQLNNEILFGTNKGTFRHEKNRIVPYKQLNRSLKENVFIQDIECDKNGKPWFLGHANKEIIIGKIDFIDNDSVDIQKFINPLHRLSDYLIGMFYPYDEKNIFIGTSERIIHFNSTLENITNEKFPVYFRSVEITKPNDSI